MREEENEATSVSLSREITVCKHNVSLVYTVHYMVVSCQVFLCVCMCLTSTNSKCFHFQSWLRGSFKPSFGVGSLNGLLPLQVYSAATGTVLERSGNSLDERQAVMSYAGI